MVCMWNCFERVRKFETVILSLDAWKIHRFDFALSGVEPPNLMR